MSAPTLHYRLHRDPRSSHQQISRLLKETAPRLILDVGALREGAALALRCNAEVFLLAVIALPALFWLVMLKRTTEYTAPEEWLMSTVVPAVHGFIETNLAPLAPIFLIAAATSLLPRTPAGRSAALRSATPGIEKSARSSSVGTRAPNSTRASRRSTSRSRPERPCHRSRPARVPTQPESIEPLLYQQLARP